MADCQTGREQNSLALRLRHLAGECRDLRRCNEWESKWQGVFLGLNEAFKAAICARSVPEPILESINKDPQVIRGGLFLFGEFQLPFAILGYHPDTFASFIEPDDCDDETLCLSRGERYVMLRPGYISSAWPGIFSEIESPVPDGVSLEDAAWDLYRSETFVIVGFYAMACDLLADWINKKSTGDESSADGGTSEAESTPKYSDDGLSPDGRTLRWGGCNYPLKPGAAGVVGLLFDAFLGGRFPYLSEDYLKTQTDTETDMRNLVRDNHLVGVVIPEQMPNGKRVNGKWGLINPQKLAETKKKTSPQ